MAILNSTEVLLFNGQIKEVGQLTTNDVLMGDDSKGRNILRVLPVLVEAIKITPHRGDSLLVSKDQLLTIKKSAYLDIPYFNKKLGRFKRKYASHPSIVSMSAEKLHLCSACFKRSFLLTKTKVEFPTQDVSIDPYFLGAWLGDGHSHLIGITSMDVEIVKCIYAQADVDGLSVYVSSKFGNKASSYIIVRGNLSGYGRFKNPLRNRFKELNLFRNKHIPSVYLQNSEEVRLKVLAGIIDTDGYLDKNVFYITQKSARFAKDIFLLANSLGFRCVMRSKSKAIKSIGFVGKYYDISISGAIQTIPTRLKRKQIDHISKKYDRRQIGYKTSMGGYHQMTEVIVGGNGRFLLGDGTIIGG
jgi:replicative DNA helicase